MDTRILGIWISGATLLCFGQFVIADFIPTGFPRASAGKNSGVSTTSTTTTSEPYFVESCGGEFYQNEGKFSSPGYPTHKYPSNSNCTWFIKVDEGKVLVMLFEHMDIEFAPPQCPFDGVVVIDNGGDGNSISTATNVELIDSQSFPSMIGKYCGEDNYKPFVSATNSVEVHFYSDDDTEQTGFVFSWRSIDAGTSVVFSCDFEDGFCEGWKNIQTEEDTFDWTLASGATATDLTGPSFDHTKNNTDGRYAYIESSKPRVANDTALLTSPETKFAEGDTEFCLEFWYHMYGESIGSLAVATAVGNDRTIHWMESGDKGDKWLPARIKIQKINKPFKIIFAGVHVGGYTGDIALDDVRLYGKSCSKVNWQDRLQAGPEQKLYDTPCANESDYPCLNTKTCIPDEKLCDGNFDCPEKEDESSYFCINSIDSTTMVPPPLEETTDYTVEPTAATDSDTTAQFETTMAVWLLNNLTTFFWETTAVAQTDANEIETTSENDIATTEIESTTAEDDDSTTGISVTTVIEFTTGEEDIATTDIVTTNVLESTSAEATTTDMKKELTTSTVLESTQALVRKTTEEVPAETTPESTAETTHESTSELTGPFTTTLLQETTTGYRAVKIDESISRTTIHSTEEVKRKTTPVLKTTRIASKPISSTETNQDKIKPDYTSTSTMKVTTTARTTDRKRHRTTVKQDITSSSSKKLITPTRIVEIPNSATTKSQQTTTEKRLVAVMDGPTAADKQVGGDGSSAAALTPSVVIIICMAGSMVQLIWTSL